MGGYCCRRRSISKLSTPLTQQFKEACEQAKSLRISDDKRLNLYALYQQANYGDIPDDDALLVDPIRKAKNKAWSRLKGTTSEDAQQYYVQLVKIFQDDPPQAQISTFRGPSIPISQKKAQDEQDKDLHKMMKAIQKSELQVIRKLIETRPELLAMKNRKGLVPFHQAIDQGNQQVFDLLLHYQKDLDIEDEDGTTALDYAIILESEYMMRELFQRGAKYSEQIMNARTKEIQAEAKKI